MEFSISNHFSALHKYIVISSAFVVGVASGCFLRWLQHSNRPIPSKIRHHWSKLFYRRCTASVLVEAAVVFPEFVEVILFPDVPSTCPGVEMYGICKSKSPCHFKHQNTSSIKIKSYLETARKTVDIAMQCVTSHQIADILAQLVRRGVRVRVIRDYENLKLCRGTAYMTDTMKDAGVAMRVNGKRHNGDLFTFGIFHHKFMIIDDKILISGSLNFTLKGVLANYENVVVTNVVDVMEPFVEYFEKAWNSFVAVG